jgi:hypothetical protein
MYSEACRFYYSNFLPEQERKGQCNCLFFKKTIGQCNCLGISIASFRLITSYSSSQRHSRLQLRVKILKLFGLQTLCHSTFDPTVAHVPNCSQVDANNLPLNLLINNKKVESSHFPSSARTVMDAHGWKVEREINFTVTINPLVDERYFPGVNRVQCPQLKGDPTTRLVYLDATSPN